MSNDWPLLSRLLDELLALPPARRTAWLARLEGDAAGCRPKLIALLSHENEAAARGFLETPPDFTLPGAEEATAEALHAPGEEIGPWRLIRPLGQGGMAEVWLAERADASLTRSLALKLPLPGFATGRMAGRFARERDLLAGLNHPRIARLYDAGTAEGGQPWLAMEAIDGRPLVQWCDDERASTPKRIELLLQVCDAVQYAHGRLVVHRDIKPNNILVTPEGEVRLLDFGIAKLLRTDEQAGAARTSLTQVSGRPMTPDWASPEQVRGEEPGIATDVYAVGVLAYRLLAGTGPYELSRATVAALEAAILDQEPRPPSTRVADRKLKRHLRGDLDTIVLRALKKTPEDRYPTVDALATDLRRHLAGLPVLARPSSWRYRIGRYLRRNRWAVAGGAVVVTSLLSGSTVALLQAQAARTEAARATAMYEFLRGLLNRDGSDSPDIQNRNTTVQDLLAEAVKQIPTALPNAPHERFRLMQDLAPFLLSTGSRDKAIELLKINAAQAREIFGAGSVEAATPMLRLAEFQYEARGDYLGAYAAASGALRVYQKEGVTDPKMMAEALSLTGFYGMRIHSAGTPSDLEMMERAATLLRPLRDRPGFGTTLEVLAMSYGEANQPAKALDVALEGLAVNRQAFGNDNWKTAAALEQASVWLQVQLRSDEAERMLREADAISQRVWPTDHFLIGRWSKYLADVLAASDRRTDALAALSRGHAILSLPKWAGSVAVRQNLEESLLDLHWRAGRKKEAAVWCDRIRLQWPRKMATSRVKAAQRCAAVAIHLGDFAAAQRLIADGTREVSAKWPNNPERMAPIRLDEADLAWARGSERKAAEGYAAVLRDASANDGETRSLAWLGLARAAPRDARLRSGGELDQALARVDALPAGYFVEWQALLQEAIGRTRLAEGAAALALPHLLQAVALRERCDDRRLGVWLARSLGILAEAQRAAGDTTAALITQTRADDIERAGRGA